MKLVLLCKDSFLNREFFHLKLHSLIRNEENQVNSISNLSISSENQNSNQSVSLETSTALKEYDISLDLYCEDDTYESCDFGSDWGFQDGDIIDERLPEFTLGNQRPAYLNPFLVETQISNDQISSYLELKNVNLNQNNLTNVDYENNFNWTITRSVIPDQNENLIPKDVMVTIPNEDTIQSTMQSTIQNASQNASQNTITDNDVVMNEIQNIKV